MLVVEEIYRSKKNENSVHFNLKIQRSLSWFKKALSLDQELDFKFMSLWIAFQAIYREDAASPPAAQLQQFFQLLHQQDETRKIDYVLWEKYQQQIQALLAHPYTHPEFWAYQHLQLTRDEWQQRAAQEQIDLQQTLQNKQSVALLMAVFKRFDSLRHQFASGGANYNSLLNRDILAGATSIFAALIPSFIQILLEYPASIDSAQPHYPMVQVS
ncbi:MULTISPECIES: hypothetical protein [Acinetobacter]|uniref:Apea-like HEPN domain-containing protein n=1 Tax=Acinetobacter indicus TaxID=756892 RepID=A0A6C0Y0J7_9GAMM|nr:MULTISPECIES: hypothetical protein [Acinetobacter]MDM1261443.1 hypothetical protein [Acinetobacter indicus]MDM1273412.1 hypothetical protein [Acinetobacter indicus]QIC69325.1 hypothetical protein FSC09_02290 [Acinetobacter indicus]